MFALGNRPEEMGRSRPADNSNGDNNNAPIDLSNWNNDTLIASLIRVRPYVANWPKGFQNWFADYLRSHNGGEPSFLELGNAMAEFNVSAAALGGGTGGGGGGPSRVQRQNAIASVIFNKASELGIQMSLEQIVASAKLAEAQNFSDEQVTDEVLRFAESGVLKPGSLLANQQNIMALASSYFVPMTEQTARDYAKRIASGEASESTILSLVRMQAGQMYSWMQPYIDRGIAPKDLLSASRDRIAASLELDPNVVDFSDSRYMKLATVTDDKGVTRLANQQELVSNIRKDNAWGSTAEARQQGSALGSVLAKIFGRSAF
jgi:hypothetical protein